MRRAIISCRARIFLFLLATTTRNRPADSIILYSGRRYHELLFAIIIRSPDEFSVCRKYVATMFERRCSDGSEKPMLNFLFNYFLPYSSRLQFVRDEIRSTQQSRVSSRPAFLVSAQNRDRSRRSGRSNGAFSLRMKMRSSYLRTMLIHPLQSRARSQRRSNVITKELSRGEPTVRGRNSLLVNRII